VSDQRPTAHPRAALLRPLGGIGEPADLRATLRRLVETATRLVHARYGAIAIRSGDGEIVEFVHVGMPEAVVAQMDHPPRGHGVLSDRLLLDGGSLRLADLTLSPESEGFPDHHPVMRSFLGVPVRVRGQIYGSLYFTHSASGIFTAEDEDIVRALSLAATAVVENAQLFEMARLREAWLRALAEVTESALSGQDRGAVLDLLAERAHEVSGCDLAFVTLPDKSGVLIVRHAFGRRSGEFIGTPVATAAAVSMAHDSGHSTIVEDLNAADVPSVFRTEFGALLAVPLLAEGRHLGVLGLLWDAPRVFAAEELQASEDFANSATLAVLLAQAQSERERLAVLEDRDRIARDLHDLVIQRLFATGMMLTGATRATDVSEPVRSKVSEVVDELDATIQEVRQAIFALRESGSDRPTGLRGRVLREVQSATTVLGFAPVLHFGGAVDSLVPDDVADDLLAALREALSNVGRHAEATWAQVTVTVGDSEVVLSVSDDGKGLGSTDRRSGLANLADRASRHGGVFDIAATEPSTGRGTRITWRAPLAR
jgi:signal transduction histidine kinase